MGGLANGLLCVVVINLPSAVTFQPSRASVFRYCTENWQAVSRTGGHLGSSLGVIELTVALHYVLDTPEDKINWDVSHQVSGGKNRPSLTGL